MRPLPIEDERAMAYPGLEHLAKDDEKVNYFALFMSFTLLLATGCASTQTTPAEQEARSQQSKLNKARDRVARFQMEHFGLMGEKLRSKSKSASDALSILRSDNIGLFPRGVEVARRQGGMEGATLEAQVEIAWGESQVVLSQFLGRVLEQLRPRLVALELKYDAERLTARESRELLDLRKTFDDYGSLVDGLVLTANDHYLKGAAVAKRIISDYPDAYQGYRVLADFYRITQEWEKFDDMVAKIEARNPDSVGLLFLRGVEARDRLGDPNRAMSYLEQALWRDQLFVRARVHLLLTQSTDEGIDRQYELLRRASPYHQIVVWGPSLMAKAYVAKKAQEAGR